MAAVTVTAAKNVLPIAEVVRHAQNAGFKGDNLVIAVAIAKAESGFDASAVGDTGITDKKYGPSIGLWQVRSLYADTGTGRSRDASRLRDPAFNARAAYAISIGGSNFKPWSVFTTPNAEKAYRRFLTDARAAVAGAPAATSASTATASGPVTLTPTVGLANAVPAPTGPFLNFIVGRGTGTRSVSSAVVGGRVDLSTTAVSEVTLKLDDPGLKLVRKLGINVGTGVTFEGMTLQVVELQVGQGPAQEQVTLRCHPLGVVRMRSTSPTAAKLSPTEYMRSVATRAGLRFVGEPSGAREVGPSKITDNGAGRAPTQRLQTAWELGQTLADQLGFLAFESAGTYYFGTASFLARRGRRVQVSWGGLVYPSSYGDIVTPLHCPDCRASSRTGFAGFLADITMKAQLEHRQGVRMRPGMAVALAGVPPFDASTISSDSARNLLEVTAGPGAAPGLLMTRVVWDLADINAPVDITAQSLSDLSQVGSGRTEADNKAQDELFGPPAVSEPIPAGKQPPRINNATRAQLFGRAGDEGRYVTYETPWGPKVRVHPMVLGRFKAACAEAQRSSRYVPRTIGSYVNRNIAGSSFKSLHSWGLAWDFFSSPPGVDPPGGYKGKQSAPDDAFLFAFKRLGFYLGQEFSSNYDPPHIEWAGAVPNDWAKK